MTENIREAITQLTQKPLLATTVERVMILDRIKSDFKELPQPLRFSKFLSVLLSEVSTPIKPYDLIAGRSVDRVLTEDEEAVFQAFIKHPDLPKKSVMFSSGHCTYSWDRVVKLGLEGMKNEAKDRLENETDSDRRVFLQAIIEVYDTIQRFMLRYADAAGDTALADVLRDAAGVPSTFASALQLLWMVAFINCAYITENPTLSLGRLDKILYPLYKKDIESGVLTRERAAEYITDYYCKHNLIMGRGEHQVGDASNSTTFSRICGFDDPRYLSISGGVENELTHLFAECIVPQFKNPFIVVRVTGKESPELWKKLCDKALESSSMMFYNDQNMISTYERLGLPAEDAKNYEHFGCNWSSPGDNSAWMQGGPRAYKYGDFTERPYMRTRTPYGWPEDVCDILDELSQCENVTIDHFYERFFGRMSAFIDEKLDYLSNELEFRQKRPAAVMSYTDCFTADSVKNAECFSATAKYHFELHSFQMFGTVADSFTAIDKLVFIDKKLTLSQLNRAVKDDFEGHPEILALCKNAPKYGQDDPLSNMHVRRLSATATELVVNKNRPYFEKQRLFLIPCMQSDTWHYKCGIGFGATPDGRRAGTPFSQNMRPSNGACKNGLTAMFNSMLNIPTDALAAGSLNLDIDRRRFLGKEQLFYTLLDTYLRSGGFHAQVTSLDPSTLEAAKRDPDSHRDIRVRVTGYSAVFTDMPEGLQDDIINRMR